MYALFMEGRKWNLLTKSDHSYFGASIIMAERIAELCLLSPFYKNIRLHLKRSSCVIYIFNTLNFFGGNKRHHFLVGWQLCSMGERLFSIWHYWRFSQQLEKHWGEYPLREKCPYSELFWSTFSPIRTRITPNTDTFYAVHPAWWTWWLTIWRWRH